MAIQKLILYILCLVTFLGKSQSLNMTDSLLPVSSISMPDTTVKVSSASILSTLPPSVTISSVPISSLSMSKSQTSFEGISASSSVIVMSSISTKAEYSSSTTVTQSVHPVTQKTSDVNTTTEENRSITTLNPVTFSIDFTFNKWSNTFPGVTSHTQSTGITNPPLERTSISQSNSSDLENDSPEVSFSSVWNDVSQDRTSSIVHELINATQTFGIGLATTEVVATENMNSSPDELQSSMNETGILSSYFPDKKFSSTTLPEESSSPLFDMFSVSGFVSSSRFDLTSISASSRTSSRIVNVSSSETVLPSLTTDYFTGSVYSLANISSSYVSDIVSSRSVEVTLEKSLETIHDVSSIFQGQKSLTSAAPSMESDASPNLSPTQTYISSSVTSTAGGIESINSSETEDHTSSIVSTSSEYIFDFSSISSSGILTRESLNVNKTPTLDSITLTSSTPFISIPLSGQSISTISSYSFTSTIITKGVTEGSSISPTTIPEASVTPTVSQTTTQIPAATPSTSTIETTPRNSTETSVEMERRRYRLMFTFEGRCERISENEVLQIEFLKALMSVTKSTTKLIPYNLEAERILCEPVRVYLLAETKGVNISHLSEPIKNKIALTDFVVPIIQNTHVLNFTATNLEIVEILVSDPNDLEVARSGLEVVDIVIISIASFLFAVLVLMMVIVICRECYVRKRTTTFHLRDVPHVNLKLSEFTLTRIPRPQMFYRENSRRKHGPVPVSKIRKPQTNGHSDTKDKLKVNQDQIRVRMSKHDDGLVVGVTCSTPPSPTNNSSSCSSTPKNGDSCKTSLLKGGNTEITAGVTNPSYSTDEELNGNTKIVILEDENEQLL